MFDVFELTLMVNHACNLRCTYCYTGAKLHRPMSTQTACAAIDRAVSSLGIGGELQVVFLVESRCWRQTEFLSGSAMLKLPPGRTAVPRRGR